MTKRGWKDKYKSLRIRFLRLEAKYFLVRAKLLADVQLTDISYIKKKRYLEVLAKLRRCQAIVIELREQRDSLRNSF